MPVCSLIANQSYSILKDKIGSLVLVEVSIGKIVIRIKVSGKGQRRFGSL